MKPHQSIEQTQHIHARERMVKVQTLSLVTPLHDKNDVVVERLPGSRLVKEHQRPSVDDEIHISSSRCGVVQEVKKVAFFGFTCMKKRGVWSWQGRSHIA